MAERNATRSSKSLILKAEVESTAAGILMLMEQHCISIADIIDAVIERDHIIGVGLITVKDQLIKIVDKHLK
jgi:hypothetical protein